MNLILIIFSAVVSKAAASPKTVTHHYKVGPYQVTTDCDRAPVGAENPEINCRHKLKKGGIDLSLKGGDRIILVSLPFLPDHDLIISAYSRGCCSAASSLDFYSDDGSLIGKGALRNSIPEKQTIYSLKDSFTGPSFALLAEKAPEEFSSNEKFRTLSYDKKTKKRMSNPVDGVKLPSPGDCVWLLDSVNRKQVTFRTGRCGESPEIELKFDCRLDSDKTICNKI